MADRWMDERDREWRDRDWRRSERFGRGYGGEDDDRHRSERPPRWDEDRSWSGAADEAAGPYDEPGRQRSYGEHDADYGGRSGVTMGGGAYGAGGVYAGGRGQAYRSGRSEARYAGQAPRFSPQDYTRGGYADEAGRADYGAASRQAYGAQADWRREPDYGERRYERDDDRRFEQDRSFRSRGYEPERDRERWERRDEGRAEEGGGDFLQRAGERISSWFRGDHLMHGSREDERGETRRYRADFGREAHWAIPEPGRERGHRGIGPKGYKRSDERINEEVHDRLTDDPWLDASNVDVEVKDGEVTLSGHVDNREAKHRAERLVEDISGVGHVQNNLRVNPDAGFTSAGRGFGSSALEAEMRRNAQAVDPGNNGVSGMSGRTSTGAQAERSSTAASDPSVDPKKRM